MNIGYDAKRLFLNDSGLGNFSRTLVEDMRQLYPTDEITLFTPRTRETPRTKSFLTSDYKIVQPRSTPKALHAWWRSMKLGTVITERGLDIYHGLSNELPVGISTSGAKSVVTIHDLIFLRFPSMYPRIDRQFYKRKSLQACKEADAIVAISQRTADDIVELLGADRSKIQVIHQGCDPAFALPHDKATIEEHRSNHGLKKDYIVCIGTVEERKNQRLLVEAYNNSKAKEELDLVIIGRHTRYAKEVESDIKQNGITDKVHLLKDLDFESLIHLLKGARMAVYPSRYEGFGLPVLEAMSAGVPILAGSGSCLEEVGGSAAVYFDPKSASELRDLLDDLSGSESLNTMREAGLERAKLFSSEESARKYYELYEALLSK